MQKWGTWEYLLNFLHFLALLLGLALTITIMATTFPAGKDKTQFYMVNTYLSSYDTDNMLGTYTPTSKPASPNQIRDSFYTCINMAEVAIDDKYRCPREPMDAYKQCIDGMVSKTRKVNTTIMAIRRIMGEYTGDAEQIRQLPSWLTSSADQAYLGVVLNSDDHRVALKNHLNLESTPLATEILNAITQTEKALGIPGCLTVVDNTVYNLKNDVGSVFDYLWQCTSELVVVEPVQKRAYDKCFPLSTWPAKDVMQGPYSEVLASSYNKYFLAVIALWLLCSFVVYTHPGLDCAMSTNGKPDGWFGRAGKFFVLFGFAWNVGGIIMVLTRSFSNAESWDYYPMSVQTVFWTVFFTFVATGYFGRELYELFFLSEATGPRFLRGYAKLRTFEVAQQTPKLQGFMRTPANADVLDECQYAPLVVPVWSDAFFFVDALLFLAIVGTNTYDVVTADLVISVFTVMFIAVTNSVLTRLLYEGYVNEAPGGTEAYKQNTFRMLGRNGEQTPGNRGLFSVRIMAMLANIMGILFQFILLWICLRYEFKTILFYVLFGSILPQVVWFVITMMLEWEFIKDAAVYFRYVAAHFLYSVLIRAIFIMIVIANRDMEYNLNIGNDDSLQKLFMYISLDASNTYSYF